MFTRIGVPLDGSKTAKSVLPYVRALSRDLRLPVNLISAIDLVEMARSVSTAEGLFLDRLVESEKKMRLEYLQEIAKHFTGQAVECHILNGNPETVISEAAAHAISSENLGQVLLRFGRLQSEVRQVHLGAHIEQSAMLTSDQIKKYNLLRGYGIADEREIHRPVGQH